jgi:hypothetical protein
MLGLQAGRGGKKCFSFAKIGWMRQAMLHALTRSPQNRGKANCLEST